MSCCLQKQPSPNNNNEESSSNQLISSSVSLQLQQLFINLSLKLNFLNLPILYNEKNDIIFSYEKIKDLPYKFLLPILSSTFYRINKKIFLLFSSYKLTKIKLKGEKNALFCYYKLSNQYSLLFYCQYKSNHPSQLENNVVIEPDYIDSLVYPIIQEIEAIFKQ